MTGCKESKLDVNSLLSDIYIGQKIALTSSIIRISLLPYKIEVKILSFASTLI